MEAKKAPMLEPLLLHLRPCPVNSGSGQKRPQVDHWSECKGRCGGTGYQFPGLGRECPGDEHYDSGDHARRNWCFRLHESSFLYTAYPCQTCDNTGRIATYTTDTLLGAVETSALAIQNAFSEILENKIREYFSINESDASILVLFINLNRLQRVEVLKAALEMATEETND